jgi:alpha-galactosidase
MLVVGLNGEGYLGMAMKARPLHPGCTPVEYRSHMSMWCMLSAPLMIGADPGRLGHYDLETLLHPGILSIDQDPSCRPCRLHSTADGIEIYVKELAGSATAVMILNTNETKVHNRLDLRGLPGAAAGEMVDVWSGERMQNVPTVIPMEPHEAKVYRIGGSPA